MILYYDISLDQSIPLFDNLAQKLSDISWFDIDIFYYYIDSIDLSIFLYIHPH